MYRQRKNDWRKDHNQLRRHFLDVIRFDGLFYSTATIGAFLLFGAKESYDNDFREVVVKALITRFNEYRYSNHHDTAYRKQKTNAANVAEALLWCELEALGLRHLDAKIVLRAIRAAAFRYYCADLDESRRFAQ